MLNTLLCHSEACCAEESLIRWVSLLLYKFKDSELCRDSSRACGAPSAAQNDSTVYDTIGQFLAFGRIRDLKMSDD